ncbi:cytochrome P450 [Kribbella amoyensis]|uniref:Cytochrome P450 n=1 Tax=Kribbella amoyensis TaxID=996641 RepID=A0A561BLN5_9ACTN|nr:cytochrome P450 [Kribbella amoyensis]TWD79738.1 cytochrome P450 [Kribbella amoyensis]
MTEPVLNIPFDDAFRFDPSPTFAELREHRPVARVRTLAGAEVWLVTRYEDVRMVLADPRFSRAAVVKQGAPRVALAKPMPNSLTTTDPPEHSRLRKLVSSTFAHRRIERTRPWVADLSKQLADDVARAGDGADLRQLVALPLPIQVICQLLGVPYEDREQFREWTELGYSMRMAEKDLVEDAMTQLTAYIEALVTRKLATADQPAEDLLDELVRAREEGDRLSQDELIAFGVNLLVAGHETSANQISSCVATLLRWPENWARLVADHSLVPSAVEELLRFNRFSEVGQLRVASEDLELHGVRIKAGDGVMAALNSANRDPRAYEAPDELRLDRQENKHLSFGFGPHFCLGAQLARIELQESSLALLRRFPNLSLAKPAEDLEWRRVLVSGLAELPVNLGETA